MNILCIFAFNVFIKVMYTIYTAYNEKDIENIFNIKIILFYLNVSHISKGSH